MFGRSAARPERIALLVDASNLYFHALTLGIRIDFNKFKQYFDNRHMYLAYAGYFSAVEEDANGRRKLQPLMDFLAHNGWSVVTKPTKSYEQAGEEKKIKGNMDGEIFVQAMRVCEYVERIVLVTGDGDFTALVEYLRERACKVTVVSSRQGNMLSSDLRKSATDVIDLADIREEISALLPE